MKPDRLLQLTSLEALRDKYPETVDTSDMPNYRNDSQFMGNLFYLENHGLIESIASRKIAFGLPPEILSARITAKGIDFLEDDGGISSILNTVTVKFNPDDIRRL